MEAKEERESSKEANDCRLCEGEKKEEKEERRKKVMKKCKKENRGEKKRRERKMRGIIKRIAFATHQKEGKSIPTQLLTWRAADGNVRWKAKNVKRNTPKAPSFIAFLKGESAYSSTQGQELAKSHGREGCTRERGMCARSAGSVCAYV